jgi:hypothetical protein
VGGIIVLVRAACLTTATYTPSERSRFREIFEVVASVGERHTSSPDRAWFAVWEGHGFDNVASRVAWRDAPADEAEQHARDVERQRLRDEDRRRNATIRASWIGFRASTGRDAPTTR